MLYSVQNRFDGKINLLGTLTEVIEVAYVPVPKDMSAVKTKVLFNLTKRQLICFGSGAAVGIPLFFLCKTFMNTSVAAILMILVMMPFMLMAMYEKNGQPLEKIVRNIIQVSFLRPKERPYRTNDFYSSLKKQDDLDKEVYSIVYGKKAHARRTKADRSGDSESEKSG